MLVKNKLRVAVNAEEKELDATRSKLEAFIRQLPARPISYFFFLIWNNKSLLYLSFEGIVPILTNPNRNQKDQ